MMDNFQCSLSPQDMLYMVTGIDDFKKTKELLNFFYQQKVFLLVFIYGKMSFF